MRRIAVILGFLFVLVLVLPRSVWAQTAYLCSSASGTCPTPTATATP